MRCVALLVLGAGVAVALAAQPGASETAPQAPEQSTAAKPAEATESQPKAWKSVKGADGRYVVARGTEIPLGLINSVSTKHSAVGDRIYFETVYPIVIDGKITIPVGSYVAGTVTQIRKPGRVKGRAELYIRFDSLTLPNGVTRDFRARISAIDGRSAEVLDKQEGKIKGEGNKAGDAIAIGGAAASGASIGAIAGGAASGSPGIGAGIGAAAGAAAGLVGVLATRGPDAVLSRGSTIQMVLDRDLLFEPDEVEFNSTAQHSALDSGGGPAPKRDRTGNLPGRRPLSPIPY